MSGTKLLTIAFFNKKKVYITVILFFKFMFDSVHLRINTENYYDGKKYFAWLFKNVLEKKYRHIFTNALLMAMCVTKNKLVYTYRRVCCI